MIGIIIITHGDFSEALLETAQGIVGKQQFIFAIAISYSEDPKVVHQRLEKEINANRVVNDWLILTDMVGGTPCNICLTLVEKFRENYEVVSGVNLYMLISAFINRDKMPLTELKNKIMEDAKSSIMDAKEKFLCRLKKVE
ncbi:MAG TPA: PTS mannose transporter subunit IID [Elusimicrobia bacterium]|nr:PTS mannose transporter subunit IID [Elusimicrobiota bacterium]